MGVSHPSFDQGYRATSSTILIDKKRAKTRSIVVLELSPTGGVARKAVEPRLHAVHPQHLCLCRCL